MVLGADITEPVLRARAPSGLLVTARWRWAASCVMEEEPRAGNVCGFPKLTELRLVGAAVWTLSGWRDVACLRRE